MKKQIPSNLNPLLPRPKGDKDAEGMKKQIPSSPSRTRQTRGQRHGVRRPIPNFRGSGSRPSPNFPNPEPQAFGGVGVGGLKKSSSSRR